MKAVDCVDGTLIGARNLFRVRQFWKIQSRIRFGKLRPNPHWCFVPG